MKLTYAISAALLVSLVTPALADEFFIVKGPDNKCMVVDKRPSTSSTTTPTMVGKKVYMTRSEAEGDMKKVCAE
jgi:hypothetical protein